MRLTNSVFYEESFTWVSQFSSLGPHKQKHGPERWPHAFFLISQNNIQTHF